MPISSPASIGAREAVRPGLRRLFAAILGLALIYAGASAEAQVVGRGVGVKGGSSDGTTPRLPSGPLFGLGGDGSPPAVPGAGGPPNQGPQDQGPHDPDLLIVVFRPGTPDGTPNDFAGTFGLTVEKQYELAGLRLRVFLMRIPAGADLDDVLIRAAADPRQLWVQRDFRYQGLQSTEATIGSPSRQYALHQIHAESMPAAARGQGVTVALIDSGVQRSHESLKGDRVTTIDLVSGRDSPPAETHGTALASIIAGSGKVQGLAPAVDLLAIRAFAEIDPKTGASEADSFRVSQAVSIALERRARIINMSIGGPNDPLVRMAVEQAVLTGVVVVAAAGNAGPGAPPVYPAAQTGVIAVTATDAKDRIFDGANRGDYIAVAAPGVDVLAARPGKPAGASAYDYFTGTSMATGYATGLAAALLSADPKLDAADLRRILESSATDLGPPKKDPEFGWGRIDAAAAFSATPTVGAAN
ncbi:MAG TPA: S8 family serine peptidase [Dongiaceae bacterium]|nr:S8 family serine peptidase [Dongiaceae bacterium]